MYEYEPKIKDITTQTVKSSLRNHPQVSAFIDAFHDEMLDLYDYIREQAEAAFIPMSSGRFLENHLRNFKLPNFSDNDYLLIRACVAKMRLIKGSRNLTQMCETLTILCNAVHIDSFQIADKGVEFYVYSYEELTDDLIYGWSAVVSDIKPIGRDIAIYVAGYRSFIGYDERDDQMTVANNFGRIGAQIR